tara:strand:+ start:221 stop:478 length:258 start_codon:yes stop_codon:yes gene_type:complete
MLIKVLAAEVALNSATNVGNATVVRVYNGHSAAVVITRTDASDSTIGSLTVVNGETVVLEKEPTDKLVASAGGTDVKGVKVAFRN